jgi:serine/threonine-protein kinase
LEKQRFQWLETAFMVSPMVPRRGRQNPFSLDPGVESAKAFWRGAAEFQPAWSWTPLNAGELDEFIDRWAGWFAEAADGKLQHPSRMPER